MNKIIVALDVPTEKEAQIIVDSIGEKVGFYKVGLQLLTSVGPSIVKKLVELDKRVFLDLKLFEIPNSVRSAVLAAGDLGVSMITVHALGGYKIMETAVSAASRFPNLEILALTVVTSLKDKDLKEVGIESTCEEQAIRLARLAKKSGCHGLVCSPLEVQALKKVDERMTIVTPGVRLSSDDSESDQKRIDTPRAAISSGASFVVLGRSITQAPNPKQVVQRIVEDLSFQ